MLLFLFVSVSSFAVENQNERVLIQKGAELFNFNCAKCHGENGVGTKQGPPLVHKIYHPNHHADLSFRWAIERGVRAHHWGFGDMPKIDGVKPDEAESIIKYIRGIQKEAGIF
jgi:mono/diheme cytochrome c family protein